MLKGVGKKGDNLNNVGNSALSGYRKANDKNDLDAKLDYTPVSQFISYRAWVSNIETTLPAWQS